MSSISTRAAIRLARRAALCLAVPALLAACAARPTAQPLPKYVAPTSGPTARLVMRGSVPAGEFYGVYLYDDSDKCAGARAVGAGNATRHPVSVDIAADRMQTVEFFLVKPNKRYCGVRWSFTPVPGKTYLLSASSIAANASSSAGGCMARVMDMSDAEHIKPEPTALRRNPAGTLQCVPIAQAKAATGVASNDAAHAGGEAVLNQGANENDLQGLIGH